jgi:streptomycin 6-kinase
MSGTHLLERVKERILDWNVIVQDTLQTQSSFLAFGTQPVVLKVLRHPGDEWRCGEVLDSFDGKGTVRVYEYAEGAVLLERLIPGTSLAAIILDGQDQEATEIIADVIEQMSQSSESSKGFTTVDDWGKGFQRYLASGNKQIDRGLVEQGQQLYAERCSSQQTIRLLHGDLRPQ